MRFSPPIFQHLSARRRQPSARARAGLSPGAGRKRLRAKSLISIGQARARRYARGSLFRALYDTVAVAADFAVDSIPRGPVVVAARSRINANENAVRRGSGNVTFVHRFASRNEASGRGRGADGMRAGLRAGGGTIGNEV